jgi:hypothetical protein
LLYVKTGHAEVGAALDTRDRKPEVLRPIGRNLDRFCSDNESQPIITVNVSTYRSNIIDSDPGFSAYQTKLESLAVDWDPLYPVSINTTQVSINQTLCCSLGV